ncbi:MAG: hypothetical protein OCD76_09045 [Reichenbachiella sp.]
MRVILHTFLITISLFFLIGCDTAIGEVDLDDSSTDFETLSSSSLSSAQSSSSISSDDADDVSSDVDDVAEESSTDSSTDSSDDSSFSQSSENSASSSSEDPVSSGSSNDDSSDTNDTPSSSSVSSSMSSSSVLLLSSDGVLSSSSSTASSSQAETSSTATDDSADFTLVVLPDTQYYTTSNKEIFPIQLDWVADNVDTWNMKFVSHVGDVVDNADNPDHWELGTTNMFKLDGKVPYGIAGGNHDSNGSGSGIYTSFSEQFTHEKYNTYSWYGGSYDDEYGYGNYQFFSAGGMQFIVVHIPYKHTEELRTWASSIFAQYPNHRGILTTHEYLYSGTNFGTGGSDLWDEIINPNPNVFMVHCGHYGTVRENYFVTNNDSGSPVIQILSDYQKDPNGGNGWLRLYKFRPSIDKIEVYTYSPFLEEYEEDSDSRFDIDYIMH